MCKNYENRVKEFVLDMTNPQQTIECKDITEKITNTREELMNELFALDPEKKKPLVFRGYISETDRIKDTIKNHKYLYYFPDYEKIKKEQKRLKASYSSSNKNSSDIQTGERMNINNKINSNYLYSSPFRTINNQRFIRNSSNNKNKKYLISQPTMRYKPRTDLERIYDVLNSYHYDEKSRDVIQRQLKAINLFDYKKPTDSINSLVKDDKNKRKNNSSKIVVSKSNNGHQRKKHFDLLYKSNKLYYNPSNDDYKPWQRREDLNTEASNLLGSYHYKTHFKAAEEIAESNYKTNRNDKNKKSIFLLPNLLPNNYKPKPLKMEGNYEEKEDPFKFEEDQNSSDQSEDYEEFDNNYNPFIQKTKTISNPEVMKTLKKIAFKNKRNLFDDNYDSKINEEKEKEVGKKGKNKKGNKSYTEDNNVFIRNKLYLKNTQFNLISNEVLEMCNVHSTKSKFNNVVHKSKGGKTMITNGMTVGEFEKKYRLQE